MKKYFLALSLIVATAFAFRVPGARYLNVSTDEPVFLEVSNPRRTPFKINATSFEGGDVYLELSSPEGGFWEVDDKKDPGERDTETFFGPGMTGQPWLMKIGLRDDPSDAEEDEILLRLDKAFVVSTDRRDWQKTLKVRSSDPEKREISLKVSSKTRSLSNVSVYLDNSFVGTTGEKGIVKAVAGCERTHAVRLEKPKYETEYDQFFDDCLKQERRFLMKKKLKYFQEKDSLTVSERITERTIVDDITAFFKSFLLSI